VLRVLGRGLTLLLAAAVLLVAVTAGRVVWAATHDDRSPADALVVLGAAQYDGTPAAYLTARLEHALALHEDGVAPVLVTVGGQQPGDRFTEAAAGRAWLVDHGVAEGSVVEVPRGGNTLASMSAVADAMQEQGLGSAVVVTDPWHSLRATRMLEQQGVDAHASPTRTGPANQGVEVAVRYTARETAAYLYWLWQRLTT
jgi:uncharacterized SAM-binding protein YcdF (DUF218 family)